MILTDAIKSLWLILFGKKLPKSLANGDRLARAWLDIYSGKPSWQSYTTRGIGGQRTEMRYLLNPAKLVCSEFAGLVFAEPPIVDADESIIEVLKNNNFTANAQSWLEYALALGTGALKWVVKDGRFIIDWVKATDFVPVSYDARGISEADFISSVVYKDKEYKIIEQHRETETGYTITLEAYENIGYDEFRKVSTEQAGILESQWSSPVKLFEAWKNPEANNIDIASPLGISVFANAVDTMQQIDIAFDYLADELETSRRKIIIPSSMIQSYFDSAGKRKDVYYDKNERVYVAFDDAEKQSMTPVAIDFDLRIEKINQTLNMLLSIFSKQCGFSDGFLSFDGTSMKTATEVISENSKTFRTKKNIENSLSYTFLSFLDSLKIIGREYGLTFTDKETDIHWDDSVIEDRNSKANYWNTRIEKRTALLEDALMAMDGLSEDEAKAKAEAIRASSATIDVGSMFGGAE
jgi:A118 family predicted phage portal protein